MNKQKFYCKLFINTEEPIEDLFNFLLTISTGRRYGVGFTFLTDNCEIDLEDNDDYNSPKYGKLIPWGTVDEFIYYKFFLDILPKDDSFNEENYIKEISDLLEKIWTRGYKAVASCGFEERLPRAGGLGYDPLSKTELK